MQYLISEVEQAKEMFLENTCISRSEDCFLFSKLKLKSEITEKVSEPEINDEINKFNKNKSYLFQLKLRRHNLSNVRKLKQFYELEEDLFPVFYGQEERIFISVEYVVADISADNNETLKSFHLKPKIEVVQYIEEQDLREENELNFKNSSNIVAIKGEKDKPSSRVVLMDFKRKGDDHLNIETKSKYRVVSFTEKTIIQGDLILERLLSGLYVVSMNIEPCDSMEKSEAVSQLGRWMSHLGNAILDNNISND